MRAFSSTQVPFPARHASKVEAFLQQLPVDFEIGCGAGAHPIQYAKAHPERRLIAVEHTREKFSKFQKQLQLQPQANLLALHANAISIVTHLIPDASVENWFLLYPNPNPKRAAQRWIRMPFFECLLQKTRPRGTLTIATNLPWYADEIENFADQWNLQLVERSTPNKQMLFPRSHFERKYHDRGETLHNLLLRKN